MTPEHSNNGNPRLPNGDYSATVFSGGPDFDPVAELRTEREQGGCE